MKFIIYYRDDVLLIFRRGIYADAHRHHGIQLTFAIGESFEAVIDQRQARHRALVISSDYPHRVVGQDEWIASLLLNPETPLAQAVQSDVLQGAAYRSLEMRLTSPFLQVDHDLTCFDLATFVSYVRDALGLEEKSGPSPDTRIATILDLVRQLPDHKIAARDLSKKVYLSESRLGHLFKAEVGIPLRHYLLWSRLMLASQIIAQGKSYTFAAYETGFTDSAHLSRTFYTMFGIRISDMFGNRDDVRVIFCNHT